MNNHFYDDEADRRRIQAKIFNLLSDRRPLTLNVRHECDPFSGPCICGPGPYMPSLEEMNKQLDIIKIRIEAEEKIRAIRERK